MAEREMGFHNPGDKRRSRRAGHGLAAGLALVALAAFAQPLGAASETPVNETCPSGGSMVMREAQLASVTQRLSERATLRVLAIGSSSTQGVGASTPANNYPTRFEAGLSQHFGANVSVTNAGVGGETVEATIERLEERITAERFDLVVWQVGTNDAVRGADEERFLSLLNRGVAVVKAKKIDLVLLDQQFYPTIKDPVRYERFVRIIEKVGDETGAPVLSRYRLMKNWGERTPQDLPTMLAGDGFHMSDRGYICLARAMVNAMSDLVTGSPLMVQGATPTMASAPRRANSP
jgi:lysophospholipase L1-like esterase